MVANTSVELEETMKARKLKNNPIQPCMLIIGTISNPTEIIIYFDEIKYTFFSVIKAIDLCFKMYRVFNIEYPIESLNVWLFIQRYFFKIKSKFDKSCPLIHQIISELK